MPSLSVVQFEMSQHGRRFGVVAGGEIIDVTAVESQLTRVTDAYQFAVSQGLTLANCLIGLAGRSTTRLSYADLLARRNLADGPVVRPPVDHADPYRVLIAGTGLTHLGSMKSRDQMHVSTGTPTTVAANEPPKTDSRKMFEWGLAGGRPAPGSRGVAPEWFYKGNGTILRGHRDPLDIPDFTGDGGEEPEIVGCYVIDDQGRPVRLGFAVGNEWSDHATEKQNYLYLAPSKLRTCSIGPELIIGHDFQEIALRCTVARGGKVLYDSGTLWSGEKHMCHSLANMEDHHFKYSQHRNPGDIHLHYFGTSKLSYGTRDWQYATGDEIQIETTEFSAPLVNVVHKSAESTIPYATTPA
ncbi:MAG: Sugar transporter [Planctomycetaceae bacterium]|nr:Sugar transporter [Planctomycetaceae bacterium]